MIYCARAKATFLERGISKSENTYNYLLTNIPTFLTSRTITHPLSLFRSLRKRCCHWHGQSYCVRQQVLHRDLEITQKTAWFLAHRLREAWSDKQDDLFSGPVEVDETYIGGKEKNKHALKKQFDRGTQGKATVMGAKQRDGKVFARPLGPEPEETLANFVHETVEAGETVYTDDHRAYKSLGTCSCTIRSSTP